MLGRSLVLNLRCPGHDLRGWVANLCNPKPNLRSRRPNLRTGVLKGARRKSPELICCTQKSAEYQESLLAPSRPMREGFHVPMRRFALWLCRFMSQSRSAIELRMIATRLHRFETRLRRSRSDRTGLPSGPQVQAPAVQARNQTAESCEDLPLLTIRPFYLPHRSWHERRLPVSRVCACHTSQKKHFKRRTVELTASRNVWNSRRFDR